MPLSTALLQAGWLASQAPAWARFVRATRDVRAAQHSRLLSLLAVTSPSRYGRAVGLDRVDGPTSFQRLPIVDHADLSPWIDRVAAGEPDVFTTEPVEMLERTGGSSGAAKLVPYTRRLRAEFAEGVGVWMVDLHRRVPTLVGAKSYWSVSRAVRRSETTVGGLRVGFDVDAEYFGPLSRWAIGRMMAVPGTVAQSPDIEAWRRATAGHLLEADDLGFISVWSPTFLTRLMQWIGDHRDDLVLSPAARARLDRAWNGSSLDGPTLWPRLRVLSAWADGFAAAQVGAMRAPFPGVGFQPKGVLATEGVVSFPFGGLAGAEAEGGVLAVTSHVLELRDLAHGRVIWPEDARVGGRYQPILTTGNGFVRYALPDELEVVGHLGQVPRVRLRGRLDRGSDLVGEKLTAAFVARALAAVWSATGVMPGFAMLVPAPGPDREGYILVLDREVPAAAVDRALRAGAQYGYARDLEQLAPARVHVAPDAWARWEAALERQGLTLGDQKPLALEVRPAVVRALLAR
ncbi:MAG: GH3 auxin-responsive promoter family protein [Pseudomonadota bacterium]|nr:GH3 auxin-responsive promoter family protein [Pseudomonadota bacterium]